MFLRYYTDYDSCNIKFRPLLSKFVISPYKTDSNNVTACTELQWQSGDTFTSKLYKQCLL